MKPIWGNEITPIEERFFSGGSMSVRGWQRSLLGPKNAENEPIGGNSLLEGSTELRYPIWNIFSGAVFLDFGNGHNHLITIFGSYIMLQDLEFEPKPRLGRSGSI